MKRFMLLTSASLLLAGLGLAQDQYEGKFLEHQLSDPTPVGPRVVTTPSGVFGFTSSSGSTITTFDGSVTVAASPETVAVASIEPATNRVVLASPVQLTYAVTITSTLPKLATTMPDVFKKFTTGLSGEITLGGAQICSIPRQERTGLEAGTYTFTATMSCAAPALSFFHDASLPLPTEFQASAFASFRFNVQSEDGTSTTRGVSVRTIYRLTKQSLDLTVSRIEVVQVVQDEENSVPLVAEKGTVARVFAKATPADPRGVVIGGLLHGLRGGAPLPGSPLEITGFGSIVEAIPDRNVALSSLNFKLPESWTEPGTITLRAEVNHDSAVRETDQTNNVREQQATFTRAPVFLVRYLRVCYRVPTLCPAAAFIANQAALARKIFPTDDTFFLYEPQASPSIVWSGTLLTSEGRAEFETELRRRWELTEAAEGVQPDQLVGWLPEIDGASGVPSSSIPLGSSDPVWFGSTGRISYAQTLPDGPGFIPGEGVAAHILAHEIAHNLGLRHPNTPDCGGCWDDKTDWPHSNSRIQEPGFDPAVMAVIPRNWFDVMTYVLKPVIWISPFHYKKLVTGKLRPRSTEPIFETDAGPAEYLLISGMAKRDGSGGRLDPVIRLMSSAAPEGFDANGNHCIRLSGSASSADYCFSLSFHRHDNRGEVELQEEAFVLKVPTIAGLTTVSLRRGESELARLTASSNSPTVQITSPASGETWSGVKTIRWTSADPDGDALTYTLLYTSDGGTTWIPMETSLVATEFAFETAEIVAGTQIRFRVIASDGINTAETTSGAITVVGAPLLEMTERSDFGSVTFGSSTEQTLVVMNRGNKAVTLTRASTSLADFRVLNTFPIALGERKSVELKIRFTPTLPGTRAGNVTVTNSEPGAPSLTASVFGSAIATPSLELAPASVSFGSVAAGSSGQQTVIARNKGLGPLTIVDLTSDNSQFRVVGPSAPFTIAAGAERQITLSFNPAAPGSHLARLHLVSDSTTGLVTTAQMTGTGTGTATSCFVGLTSTNATFTTAGGTGSIDVTAGTGCAWTLTSNADWVVLTSVASGVGAGRVDFAVRQNPGTPRRALVGIPASGALVAIAQQGGPAIGIIPAIASAPGALGSFFKTTVQLHNREATPISGSIVFHPSGVSGTSEDPSLYYELAPGETLSFSDALDEMRQEGIGSADLVPRVGGIPDSSIRIFNDAGEAGTTGMTEELFAPDAALEAGERGILVAPPEPSRARFNIGVRSLGFGANMTITVRDKDGNVRGTVPKGFPANFFGQQGADAFLGLTLLASDSISIAMNSGSAIVYGATNDNTTQDPSLQFARPLPVGADTRRVIPVVAAVRGAPPSLFKTAVQLHNPSSSTIAGRLVFHPAGIPASPADPSVDYTLPAGTTLYYPDILTPFNRDGLGSVDVVATTGSVPVAVARIFNDAGVNGTTGFSADAMRPDEALQPGESGVLIAPPDLGSRFNIGLRTLDEGVSMTITVRSASGNVTRTFDTGFAANYFQQQSAAAFLGLPLAANDTVTIAVRTGSVIVYGAATDNKTQDPAIQVARRAIR